METNHSNCIFCNIIAKNTDTEILLETEDVVVFRDIKPASDYHFLAVPKKHIDNTRSLKQSDKELVSKLKQALVDLMAEKQMEEAEISYGFHVPPFNSVKHLHMHGIAPTSKMGFLGRMIFKPNSYWYKSVEYVVDNIKEESAAAGN